MTTTSVSSVPRTGALLRLALRLDAAVTGLNGAAYLLAAPLIDDVLGLPAGLLRGVGVFLIVFAAAVWLAGARLPMNIAAVRAVITLNALWVLGSLAAVVTDAGGPSTVGVAWIVLQAGVVAAFALLQAAGLRRS